MSVEQLFRQLNAPKEPIKISDKALNGYICGFHVVTNFRTGDKFILGGADDGSIAFWTIAFVE
jgi:hypothetical protein